MLTDIETDGNLFLRKNASDELFISTPSGSDIAVTTTSGGSGGSMTEENWSGWFAKAAENISSQNYIGFVNGSDSRLWTAEISDSGVYTSGLMYNPGATSYYDQEPAFNVDFNGDGTIGTP